MYDVDSIVIAIYIVASVCAFRFYSCTCHSCKKCRTISASRFRLRIYPSCSLVLRSWVTSACSRTARARATAAPAVLYQARGGEESVRYMELEILVERAVILAVGPYHCIVEP